MSFKRELEGLEAASRRRVLRAAGPALPRMMLDGREVLSLSSNNYLGLTHHPKVIAAAQKAAEHWGTGSGASRLIAGNQEPHRRLEKELARFKGAEDCILFGSGALANLGAIPALVGDGDLVFSDQLNHASLIDGCRLSKATTVITGHADAALVREAILDLDGRRRMVVTDGLFSMDGDLAPLASIAETCSERGVLLYVDDAHGTGTLGPDGRGTAAAAKVTPDFQMGTLSKALGAEGGFIAASHDACEVLRNKARTFVFSTAPSPVVIEAARAALKVVVEEPERRQRLAKNAKRLREGLADLGLQVLDGPGPIVPVLLGDEARAMGVMQRLLEEGVYAAAIRPPTVPVGQCRIRATVMSEHTADDIDAAVEAFRVAMRPT